MNQLIISLISSYAALYGVDPKVAISVAIHESKLNPNAIGSAGEIGVFQLLPRSFPQYSRKQLFNIETNIRVGVKYLAWNKKNCKHKDGLNYLTCFNVGVKKASNFKYPQLHSYVKKIRGIMTTLDKEYSEGQKVIVKGLYAGGSDGEGIYMGVSQEHHSKGMFKILNEYGTVMYIEPSRVSDYNQHWQQKKLARHE